MVRMCKLFVCQGHACLALTPAKAGFKIAGHEGLGGAFLPLFKSHYCGRLCVIIERWHLISPFSKQIRSG